MDVLGPSYETQIGYHRRRLEELRAIRTPWEGEWTALADFMEPTRLRLVSRNERPSSRKRIIDETGTFALITLKNGMHSGLTSPARPWFKLSMADQDLRKFGPVKTYLADVEDKMRAVFRRSNLYSAFHAGYGDLGQFGQSASILVEDTDKTIRMIPLVHGRFWIARDYTGRAVTLYRTFRWSVQKLVQRFGWKNVGQTIQNLYSSNKYSQLFDVWHAIEPRADRDPRKIDKKNKPYLSNYWLDETAGNVLLEQSGFDENPIIAPTWELSEDDTYSLSPGMIALGSVRMLQKEQTSKLEGIDKKVRPPMVGPMSMKNAPRSMLPGAMTFVDDPTGRAYRPAMEVNFDLNELREDIGEVQQRIKQVMYADLFFAISQMEGIQPRNDMEIVERKEEKLLQLGPVLENIYNGQLEPVIERTFNIMNRNRLLPPPPPELAGVKLSVEYTSMLAQAQQAVSTGAIERGYSFAGQLAAVDPTVMDKLDNDAALETYFDMIGAPPSIMKDEQAVEEKRNARAQQEQQAQQVEAANKMAPAISATVQGAQVLSQANDNPTGNGLLQQLGLG